MKLRFSLYVQTLAMLTLYLGTLLLIIFFLFNAKFGLGWEAAMQSPLGERFATIAGAISGQLRASKPASYDAVLKSFGDIYHAQFYVFDERRKQVAGEKVELPAAVLDRIGLPPMMALALGPHLGNRFERPTGPIGKFDQFGPHPGPEQGPPPGGPPGFGPPGFGPREFGHGPEQGFGPGPGPGNGFPDHLGPPPNGPINPFGPHFMPTAKDLQKVPEPPPALFLHAGSRFLVHTQNPDRFWICARIFVFSPELNHSLPGMLVATCDNLLQTSLIIDFQFVTIVLSCLLAFSVLFWWPFIYRITSALSRLTQATESIAQGKFDTRVQARGDDEIGRLSNAVDTMAERLEGYVNSQKRLLADISHELFSPLARLQLALELLESHANQDQESNIADIREEVQEMNNLVSELIAYSKAGMQAKNPAASAINLSSILETLLPKLSDASKVKVEVSKELKVSGDRLLIERAISNVIRNAIRYAGDHGPIEVKASGVGANVILTISDNGPGVSEDALKHLLEPFYRPEPSRNRSMGGFGLGLAIVKSCIEACDGTVQIRNKTPNGLEVKMTLKAG